MDLSQAAAFNGIAQRLRSWTIQPRRIGGRTYQGECQIARVLSATYQQQSTTFGRTAGILGLSSDGRGFVTGGGGFVDTVHRGLVSAVMEDETGRHLSEELPAAVAALEGSVLRLDRVNGRLVAVTNVTGRQQRITLLGSEAFIGRPPFTRRDGILLLAAIVSVGQIASHPLPALALATVFGALPVIRLRRIALMHRRRTSLSGYIEEVTS
ncbi:hypothetical protein KZ813_16650 [Sphingomonas sp. RHCKR7]|uniref:hypothetical protein n=1 Tax=Sphingomonas folli TaxID=2862497 RepID=UPI001CA5B767|nr:hypothetical protein [Sphingomonas folli]MBW6528475.1 hypothetical protein [Sphingomonas folli]